MDRFTIDGACPACGGQLRLLRSGTIACTAAACPQPEAAHTLLNERELGHLIDVSEHDLTIQHPLRERAAGSLFACRLYAELAAAADAGQPLAPGRYRAVAHRPLSAGTARWAFVPISAESDDA